MKKLLTIIAYCTFLSTSLYAQKLEIKYQEILNVNKDKLKENMKFESSGSGNLPSDFFDNIIKSMIEPKDFTLSIYDNLSIYKKVEKINNKQGSNFSISFGDADNSIYKDSFTKEYSKNVSLMDKSYLIKDKLTDYKWKLTRETKKIIGFDELVDTYIYQNDNDWKEEEIITKNNGVFNDWNTPYNYESKALTPKDLIDINHCSVKSK